MRGLGLLLAALAASLALAACSASVTVYKPLNADQLTGHTVLMMSATRQASVPEDALEATLAAIEAGLAHSPDVGPVTTRAQFQQAAADDFRIRDDYRTYSDLASNVGMVDQEAAWRLATFAHVQLLASVDVYQVTCPVCPGGDALVLVGQLVDAAQGDLVWRATLRMD
ncbi:MAG TPA: hypothetical protein VL359_14155, partial [bacterium]|nr:hypothetical protein [bacterium]